MIHRKVTIEVNRQVTRMKNLKKAIEAIVVKDGSSYYYPGVIKEFFEDEKNDPYEIEFYNDAVNNRFYNKEDINKFPKNFKVNGAVQVFKDKENKWISRKVTDNNITGDNGKEKI